MPETYDPAVTVALSIDFTIFDPPAPVGDRVPGHLFMADVSWVPVPSPPLSLDGAGGPAPADPPPYRHPWLSEPDGSALPYPRALTALASASFAAMLVLGAVCLARAPWWWL